MVSWRTAATYIKMKSRSYVQKFRFILLPECKQIQWKYEAWTGEVQSNLGKCEM